MLRASDVTSEPIIITESIGGTCSKPDYTQLHMPFGKKTTPEIRKIDIIGRVLFGFVFLILRYILSLIHTGKDKFFIKSLKALSNQMILYFIIVGIIHCLYTYGALDTLRINWQFFLSSLFVLGIVWFLYGILVAFFCYLIVLKWNYLEENTTSFGKSNRLIYFIYRKFEK